MTKERKRGLSLILAMLMLFVTFSGSLGTAAYAEEAAAETTGETVSEISGGSQTEELRDLAVYSRNFITAYCHESGKQYDIRGDERFNALKYYDLLRESEDPANDTH